MERKDRNENFTVVIVGDSGSGKTSLVETAKSGKFPVGVERLTRLARANLSPVTIPSVMPSITLPANVTAYDIPITVIDTESLLDNTEHLPDSLFQVQADAIILTYECHRFDPYGKLTKFWLPNLKLLKSHLEDLIKDIVPIIVVGMKQDLRCGEKCDMEYSKARFGLLASECPNVIETYVEVSIRQHPWRAREVLYYSIKGVMHPNLPLYDWDRRCLSFHLIRALKRIFHIFDVNRDGYLSEHDLKKMHQASWGEQLSDDGVAEIRGIVTHMFPQGFDHRGLSLEGFLHLHNMYGHRSCHEHTWAVLAWARYDITVKFSENRVPLIKPSNDEALELSDVALKFLERRFRQTLLPREKVLSLDDVESLLKYAQECPWYDRGYLSRVERTTSRGLSKNGYMCLCRVWNQQKGKGGRTELMTFISHLSQNQRSLSLIQISETLEGNI